MSGDPSNARLWPGANVYVSFDLSAPNPADTDAAFSAAWDLVGILDGDEGFTESRDEDTQDHFGWGVGIIRMSYRNAKETHSFTAVEDNETVRRLRNRGPVTEGVLEVPSGPPERVRIAFEVIDGATVHRRIYDQAEVMVDGDINQSEAELSTVPFVATIFGDDDGVAGAFQESEAASA